MKMKGTIERMILKDFITYKEVEFVPAKHLNLIIGPNGTGKSTLNCAIILGLGGKPKLIGRSLSLEAYIRAGCQSATIEIELYNPDGNNKIKRTINIDGKSVWQLNDRPATQKQVEQLVSSLNIQLDNLCQFLPQDRVAEFARMTPQQILENTEKCIGSSEMYENHVKLKEQTKTEKGLEEQIKSLSGKMKGEEQQNSRMAVVVENIAEKEKLLEEVKQMRKKQGWLYYEESRAQLMEMKNDKENAVKKLKEHEARLAPINKAINRLKEEGRKIEQSLDIITQQIDNRSTEITRKLEQLEQLKEKIDETENECRGRIEDEERRRLKLQITEQQISKLENDLKSCTTAGSTRAAIEELITQLNMKADEYANHTHEIEHFQTQHENICDQIRAHEQELQREQDVGRQRMELLHRYNKDVYTAVNWLREHKHMFKGCVYEPMMLEINIPNPQHAKYVESVIPRRDLLAFTCEEKEDMNNLLRILRGSRKLQISVLHSGSQHNPSSAYKPNIPLDNLRKFGFQFFIIDMLTAPEAIKAYLCRSYSIHTVPVGNRSTSTQSGNVPPSIHLFFSDTHSYSVKVSKYSRERSTRSAEIPSANFLGLNTNTELLQKIKQKLEKLLAQKEEISVLLASKREAAEHCLKELNKIREKKKRLEDSLKSQQSIQASLSLRQREKNNLERQRIDPNEEKEKCKKLNQRIASQLCDANLELYKSFQKLQEFMINHQLKQKELIDIRCKISKKEAASEEMNQMYMSGKQLVQKIEQRIEEQRRKAKQLFEKARTMSNGIAPGHPKYTELVNSFDSFPSTIEELDRAILNKQAKADCLEEANPLVRQEYETRKRTIAELKQKIETIEENLMSLRRDKEEIKKIWLPRLTTLIEQINDKFGQYFAVLRCAGEVSLMTGNNKEDYEGYGIQIKVKYREGETLQQLTHQLQSGGERATATAIYLIALQGLTHIPFCCVDEINQGMDAVNERYIFDLLVQTTSQIESAQYFLFSPKLLPGLNYGPTVTVHTIFNGGKVTGIDINKIIVAKKKK